MTCVLIMWTALTSPFTRSSSWTAGWRRREKTRSAVRDKSIDPIWTVDLITIRLDSQFDLDPWSEISLQTQPCSTSEFHSVSVSHEEKVPGNNDTLSLSIVHSYSDPWLCKEQPGQWAGFLQRPETPNDLLRSTS